jgi:uncharacterized protein (DUF4415 family)
MKKTSTKRASKTPFDRDNPEWTSEDFKRAVPFSGLPEDVQHVLRGIQGKRGPQKTPKKIPISIRLSPDVAEGLRATGEGWQVRADAALRDWLSKNGAPRRRATLSR